MINTSSRSNNNSNISLNTKSIDNINNSIINGMDLLQSKCLISSKKKSSNKSNINTYLINNDINNVITEKSDEFKSSNIQSQIQQYDQILKEICIALNIDKNPNSLTNLKNEILKEINNLKHIQISISENNKLKNSCLEKLTNNQNSSKYSNNINLNKNFSDTNINFKECYYDFFGLFQVDNLVYKEEPQAKLIKEDFLYDLENYYNENLSKLINKIKNTNDVKIPKILIVEVILSLYDFYSYVINIFEDYIIIIMNCFGYDNVKYLINYNGNETDDFNFFKIIYNWLNNIKIVIEYFKNNNYYEDKFLEKLNFYSLGNRKIKENDEYSKISNFSKIIENFIYFTFIIKSLENQGNN